jgi:hypothetical protein
LSWSFRSPDHFGNGAGDLKSDIPPIPDSGNLTSENEIYATNKNKTTVLLDQTTSVFPGEVPLIDHTSPHQGAGVDQKSGALFSSISHMSFPLNPFLCFDQPIYSKYLDNIIPLGLRTFIRLKCTW